MYDSTKPNEGGKTGVRKAKNSTEKEEVVYAENKRPNKSCADTVNLPVVLLMFPSYSRVIQWLLKDDKKSISYAFHSSS